METRPASPILSTSSVTMAKSLNHTTVCNWRSLTELEATGNPPTPHHTMFCGGRDLLSGLLWRSSYILQSIPLYFTPHPRVHVEEGKFCIATRCLFKVHQFQRHLWLFSGEKVPWGGDCLVWSTHLHSPRTSPAWALTVPCPRKLSVSGKPQPSRTLMWFRMSLGHWACTWAAWRRHKAECKSQPTRSFCFPSVRLISLVISYAISCLIFVSELDCKSQMDLCAWLVMVPLVASREPTRRQWSVNVCDEGGSKEMGKKRVKD